MTDHVFGEDSYVECDRYNVVSTRRDLNFGEYEFERRCYCGEISTQIARVGFHTETTDETPGEWPTSFSRILKTHRCDEHAFEIDEN